MATNTDYPAPTYTPNKPFLNTDLAPNLAIAQAGGYSPSKTPVFGQDRMNVPVVQPNAMDAKTQLNQQVMQNMQKSQEAMNQTQKGLGITGQEKQFANRGYMINKELVATNEYSAAEKQRKQVSKDLARIVAKGDEASVGIAEELLNQKFKAIEFEYIKKAVAFDAKLKKQGIDEQQRRAAAAMWGTLAGTVVGGAIGTMIAPGLGTAVGAGMGATAGGAVGTYEGSKQGA